MKNNVHRQVVIRDVRRQKASAMKMKSEIILLAMLLFFTGSQTTRAAQLPPSSDWSAPPTAARTPNPVAADGLSVARGNQLYQIGCLPCHGTKGAGDGSAASSLERHPGILSDSKLWQQTDGTLFWKISQGRSPMPSFAEAFSDAQRWDILNYVRTLAQKPPGFPAVVRAAETSTTPKTEAAPVKTETTPPGTPASAGDKYVTREEYDQLRKQFETLQAQLQQLTGQKTAAQGTTSPATTIPALKEETSALSQELQGVKKTVSELKSGTTKHLLTGFAFAGYTDQKAGSSFNAGFNPIFLWQPTDRLFFESELELGLEDGKTEVNLEYAHLSYLLNDYITLGLGEFLTPFGMFRERLHPAWINKLPDAPMAFGHHGLLPPSTLGVQARGGFPVGTTKMNYSFYLGNGPTLNVGDDEPDEAGMLHFDNFDNFRAHKTAGARLGFLPLPQLEIGYSGLYAHIDAAGNLPAPGGFVAAWTLPELRARLGKIARFD